MQLVLASTSPFRKQLLERLGLPFTAVAPDTDETPRTGESPAALVARLAESKARAMAKAFPDAVIIGSDQTAEVDGTLLNKPGTHANAVAQLASCSGRVVSFYTGLCVLDARTGTAQTAVELFHVHFRTLTAAQIETYLRREQPYNCAGSFKSEGLGIALFERLEGSDPTALVGLPLIRLVSMLERAGVPVL
jgi:MAF protein